MAENTGAVGEKGGSDRFALARENVFALPTENDWGTILDGENRVLDDAMAGPRASSPRGRRPQGRYYITFQ